MSAPEIDGALLRVDEALDHLRGQATEDTCRALFALMDDNPLLETAIWSIIHFLESCDDSIYYPSLLSSLPALADKAPGWGMTLVARILNDPPSILAMLKVLPKTTADQREGLRGVLNALATYDDSVKTAAEPLMLAMNAIEARPS